MGFIKPLAGFFGEDGGGEGAEDFAVLDAPVQYFFHLGAARVGDDTAVAERAGAPFGAALIPAEDFSVGDDGGGAAQEFFFREFGDCVAALRDGAGLYGGADFFGRIGGAPIGVIHREGAWLAEDLVPDGIGGADGDAGIPGGGVHVELFEWRGVENFSVCNAIEGDSTGEADGFCAGLCGEFLQHAEVDLLEAGLESGSKVAMALF